MGYSMVTAEKCILVDPHDSSCSNAGDGPRIDDHQDAQQEEQCASIAMTEGDNKSSQKIFTSVSAFGSAGSDGTDAVVSGVISATKIEDKESINSLDKNSIEDDPDIGGRGARFSLGRLTRNSMEIQRHSLEAKAHHGGNHSPLGTSSTPRDITQKELTLLGYDDVEIANRLMEAATAHGGKYDVDDENNGEIATSTSNSSFDHNYPTMVVHNSQHEVTTVGSIQPEMSATPADLTRSHVPAYLSKSSAAGCILSTKISRAPSLKTSASASLRKKKNTRSISFAEDIFSSSSWDSTDMVGTTAVTCSTTTNAPSNLSDSLQSSATMATGGESVLLCHHANDDEANVVQNKCGLKVGESPMRRTSTDLAGQMRNLNTSSSNATSAVRRTSRFAVDIRSSSSASPNQSTSEVLLHPGIDECQPKVIVGETESSTTITSDSYQSSGRHVSNDDVNSQESVQHHHRDENVPLNAEDKDMIPVSGTISAKNSPNHEKDAIHEGTAMTTTISSTTAAGSTSFRDGIAKSESSSRVIFHADSHVPHSTSPHVHTTPCNRTAIVTFVDDISQQSEHLNDHRLHQASSATASSSLAAVMMKTMRAGAEANDDREGISFLLERKLVNPLSDGAENDASVHFLEDADSMKGGDAEDEDKVNGYMKRVVLPLEANSAVNVSSKSLLNPNQRFKHRDSIEIVRGKIHHDDKPGDSASSEDPMDLDQGQQERTGDDGEANVVPLYNASNGNTVGNGDENATSSESEPSEMKIVPSTPNGLVPATDERTSTSVDDKKGSQAQVVKKSPLLSIKTGRYVGCGGFLHDAGNSKSLPSSPLAITSAATAGEPALKGLAIKHDRSSSMPSVLFSRLPICGAKEPPVNDDADDDDSSARHATAGTTQNPAPLEAEASATSSHHQPTLPLQSMWTAVKTGWQARSSRLSRSKDDES